MNIIIMILLISFLILIHELGHFMAAKAFKIKVDKFGFGLPFGPVLFRKQIGETEFLIHALLLGGYVSFPDDDVNSELPEDSPERFQNKPVYQKAIVVSAGVVANVICAIFLVMLTALIWQKLPAGKYDIEIAKIIAPKDAAVHKSGLQKEDKIYKINGSLITLPYQVNKYAALSKKYDGKISPGTYAETLENLKKINTNIKSENEPLKKGVKIQLTAVKDEPALHLSQDVLMGLGKYKEKLLTLDAKQIKLRDSIQGKKEFVSDGATSLSDIAYALSDTKRPMNFTVIRNGREINLKPIYSDENGTIGIQQKITEVLIPTKTPGKIITASCDYVWTNTELMIVGLVKLFTGQIPMQDLHGIVAITKLGGDVIEHQGLFKGLLLTAIISLNLAIINLLPIPALDGGHLLFLTIEKIKGKPLDEKTIEKIGNIGFSFLLILMFLIIFNDIFALITKKI